MAEHVFRAVVAILLGLCVFSNSLAPRPAHAQERGQPDRNQRDIAATVHAMLGPWIDESRAPGVIVVVRYGGRTHCFPFGEADRARRQPVTAETIFELASITKVFTTTSLAMEVEAGHMRLEDSVARYAPYLDRQGKDIKRVTLLELATHTSALPRVPNQRRPDNQWNKPSMMEWFAEWRAKVPPGSRYQYSNIALGLLGYAIENREEKPLLEVWREQFLRSLQMNHTFFAIPPAEQHLVVQGYGAEGQPVEHSPLGGWPAGGRLSSSGRDMGEFLTANLGERVDLPQITKAIQLAQQPRFKVSEQMTLALAWQRIKLNGELVIDKNGGLAGTSTYIGMLPERKIGVVVMANRGKCRATGIGRRLLLALAGKEHQGGETDEE